MPKRKLTVSRAMHLSGGFGYRTRQAVLRLKGQWLERAGFAPGSRADVTVEAEWRGSGTMGGGAAMADAVTWYISAETVHNWRNRAREWAVYYRDLPADVRRAIEVAHDGYHGRAGMDAGEAARDLCKRFPCLVYG